MNQNAEATRKEMKKKLVDELAKTVIETAKAGKWNTAVTELSDDSFAGQWGKFFDLMETGANNENP